MDTEDRNEGNKEEESTMIIEDSGVGMTMNESIHRESTSHRALHLRGSMPIFGETIPGKTITLDIEASHITISVREVSQNDDEKQCIQESKTDDSIAARELGTEAVRKPHPMDRVSSEVHAVSESMGISEEPNPVEIDGGNTRKRRDAHPHWGDCRRGRRRPPREGHRKEARGRQAAEIIGDLGIGHTQNGNVAKISGIAETSGVGVVVDDGAATTAGCAAQSATTVVFSIGITHGISGHGSTHEG